MLLVFARRVCASLAIQSVLWVLTFIRTQRRSLLFLSGFRAGGLVLRFLVAAFPLLGRGGLALLRGFGSLNFTRVVNQFNDRELGTVTFAMAQFQNARVAAGPILVAISKVTKQSSQRRNSSRALGPQLPTLAGNFADAHVARVKENCRLSPQVQRLCVRAIVRQTARPARQSDRAFDKWSQLLRLGQSGDDTLLARVDQRGRQVAQHRVTMLTGATEFSMCL